MNRFLMGMYGRYDEVKFQRDFRPDFYGIEACVLKEETDAQRLSNTAREKGFHFGVHFPLIKRDYSFFRDPFLFSRDPEEREKAFGYFQREAAYVASLGASYLLTHFPKPVLVERGFDLQHWRFAGPEEWMYADLYPWEELERNVIHMFHRLQDISRAYQLPIYLENDAMPACLAKGDFLTEQLKAHPDIGICLDACRLFMQQYADPGFEALAFAGKVLPYVRHVHLWNTSPQLNPEGGHFPVNAGQKPSEGWADIAAFLKLIRPQKEITVLFEHRSDLIGDEELQACYDWVAEMLEV